MKLLRALLLVSPAAFAADYIGSQACKTCHPDVWSTFYKNPHFKSVASGKESPENTGCESCHGPGQAHVNAHGGKATIVAFSQLGPEKTLNACLRCHGETLSRANIRRSSHTQQDVVCTNCHSIHKSTAPQFLLAKPQQSELCYTCHASVRAQFSMPFKHRVNEGVVKCTDCHNPHGAFDPTWRMASRPRMIEQARRQRRSMPQVPHRQARPLGFRARLGPRRTLRDVPSAAWLDQSTHAAPARGVHAVSGMS